jgi:hypothetical protein
MAAQQAWEDWERLVRLSRDSKQAITNLFNILTAHVADMNVIIDDVPRKNAAKEIADIHPVYTVAWFGAARTDFNQIIAWMQANGYGS